MMYQLYYCIDGSKAVEEFATYDDCVDRAEELAEQLRAATTFLAQIIDPDGTMVQEATR